MHGRAPSRSGPGGRFGDRRSCALSVVRPAGRRRRAAGEVRRPAGRSRARGSGRARGAVDATGRSAGAATRRQQVPQVGGGRRRRTARAVGRSRPRALPLRGARTSPASGGSWPVPAGCPRSSRGCRTAGSAAARRACRAGALDHGQRAGVGVRRGGRSWAAASTSCHRSQPVPVVGAGRRDGAEVTLRERRARGAEHRQRPIRPADGPGRSRERGR